MHFTLQSRPDVGSYGTCHTQICLANEILLSSPFFYFCSWAQSAPLAERLQRFRQRQQRYNSAEIDDNDLSAEQITFTNLHRRSQNNQQQPGRGAAHGAAVDAVTRCSTDALDESQPAQQSDGDGDGKGNGNGRGNAEEATPRRRVLIKRRIVRSTRARSVGERQTSNSTCRSEPSQNSRPDWLSRLWQFCTFASEQNSAAAAEATLTTGKQSLNRQTQLNLQPQAKPLPQSQSQSHSQPDPYINPIMAVLRTMKLKERLAISLGATLVLLTLLLIVDVQMDFGVANRHLLQQQQQHEQQHQRLRYGNNNDYNEVGQAGGGGGGLLHEFKRKFLQKR